jgi:PAS domain S-box-containing protein
MRKKPAVLSTLAELRRQAELKLQERQKKRPATQNSTTDMLRLVHQLEVHQIELEMQNEELIAVGAELDAAVEQYTDLYDFAPVGYFTLTRNGQIRMSNLAGSKLLRAERSHLVGQYFEEFVAHASQAGFRDFLKNAFSRSTTKANCELMLRSDDVTPLWVHLEADVDANQSDSRRVIVNDITERKQAAEKIKQSEERYRSLIEQAADGIFISDSTGKYIDVNSSGCAMLGYTRAELLEKYFSELLPVEDKEKIPPRFDELRAGKAVRSERRLICKDGSLLEVEISGKMLTDGRLQGIVRDVTERRQAEEKLKQREEYFRALVENISDVIVLVDEEGRILYTTPSAQNLLGYTIAELQCRRSFDLIHPDDLATAASIFAVLLNEPGLTAEIQIRVIRKDGRTRWVDVSGVNLLANPAVGAIVSIYHDITKQVEIEASLRHSQEQISGILASSPDAIISMDGDQKIMIFNHAAEKIFGCPAKEALGQPLDRFLPEYVRDKHQVHILTFGESHITNRDMATSTLELTCLRVNGEAFPSEISISQIEYNGEKIYTAIVRDITERKRVAGMLQTSELTARQMANNLRMVNQIGAKITAGLELERLLLALYEECQQIGDTDQFYVSLYDDATEMINFPFNYEQGKNVPIPSRRNHTVSGITEYILEHRQTLYLPDADELPEEGVLNRNKIFPSMMRSYVGIPLMIKDRVVGVLSMQSLAPNAYTPNQIQTLELLSIQAAIAIQNAQLYQQARLEIMERERADAQIQHQLKRLKSLHTIDTAINSSFDSRVVLEILLKEVISRLGVDTALILLLGNNDQYLKFAAAKGFHTPNISQLQVRLKDDYAIRQVGLEYKMIHIPNLVEVRHQFSRAELFKDENFVEYIRVPLACKGRFVGVLELFHRSALDLDPEWLNFLEILAGQAAISIDNAQLFEDLQRSNAELEQRVLQRTAELHRTNIELEHANRIKSEFLANMSHELRTPLNSILGLSETLLEQRRDPLSEHQQRSLQIIESSGHHLLDLINDILDISKIEAGKFDYYPQVVTVDEVCRTSLSFVKETAVKKSISLNYEPLPQASKIYADPRRLKQILVNLLTNAVKFTPDHGKVDLKVTADAEQDLMRFSVIDTGIGIAAEDLRKLFVPFTQVDSSLTREYEGTGLGLALIQKLTDLHGGSVEVESDGLSGKGSRFTINLRWGQELIAQQTSPKAGNDPLLNKDDSSLVAASQPPREHGTILLAEDNVASVLMVEDYLTSRGYQVVVAHDGLEAIEKTIEFQPNLILMDIQMPSLNGLEAIRRLRADPRFGSTPIIALTALAMPGDREHCLAAGANEYMSKPVTLKGLVKTIHALLDLKQ